jgi:hypothetical protein
VPATTAVLPSDATAEAINDRPHSGGGGKACPSRGTYVTMSIGSPGAGLSWSPVENPGPFQIWVAGSRKLS